MEVGSFLLVLFQCPSAPSFAHMLWTAHDVVEMGHDIFHRHGFVFVATKANRGRGTRVHKEKVLVKRKRQLTVMRDEKIPEI